MWAHGETANERTVPAKPKISEGLKAVGPSPEVGDGDGTAGEVDGLGTHEEDDPVTWEIPTSPRDDCGSRSTAKESSEGPGVLRVHTEAREEQDTFREVDPRQGEPESRSMGVGKSEGRIHEQ
jgi:hypothetical protein